MFVTQRVFLTEKEGLKFKIEFVVKVALRGKSHFAVRELILASVVSFIHSVWIGA